MSKVETAFQIVLGIICLVFIYGLFSQHSEWVNQNCKDISGDYPITKLWTSVGGSIISTYTEYHATVDNQVFTLYEFQYGRHSVGDIVHVHGLWCPYLAGPQLQLDQPEF